MDKSFVDKYVNEKISKGEDKVSISFFDIRVKNNFSEAETEEFIKFAKSRLEKAGFKVYLSGIYEYHDFKHQVNPNELLVAIKENR
jgi:hypothetical protein